MTCNHCGSSDHRSNDHYKLVQKIEKKGFPTSSKKYPSAHKKADASEKEKFSKGYEKMKSIDRNLPKGELAGKNTKSGKIEVSKKVPKPLRKEVAYHEKVESKQLRKTTGAKK